jgi:hypothetical protein
LKGSVAARVQGDEAATAEQAAAAGLVDVEAGWPAAAATALLRCALLVRENL